MYAPFVISGKLWHEISEKVAFDNTNFLKKALNDNLQLTNYGAGINGIALVFVTMPADDSFHEEEMKYNRTKREVNIQTALPFEFVKSHEKPAVLHLMATTYLNRIKELTKLKIPDFNLPLLIKDVEKLFEEKGWLLNMPAN